MSTLGSYVEELRRLCGNRTDVDDVAVTSVNAALASLVSKDILTMRARMTTADVTVSATELTTINVPSGFVTVSAVAWAPLGATSGFRELKHIPLQEMLVADMTTNRTPLAWTLIGSSVMFSPIVTEGFTVKMLCAEDYNYLTAFTDSVPIANIQRPVCIALARAFMSYYLGEPETGQGLAAIARLLDNIIPGRHGMGQILRTEGVKPYAVD